MLNRISYRGSLFTNEKTLFFHRLKCTQDRARELVKNGIGETGYVIVADEQYRGRGRFGRQWSSESGRSLTFSLIVEKVSILPIRAALSVVETLKEECEINAEIKWPNDIIVNRKKISGILVEMERNFAIVGVGLNVNETVPPFANATSVRIETGRPANRERVLSSFLYRFECNLQNQEIMGTIKEHLSFMNKYTEIETTKGIKRGEFIDLGEEGEIIIRTDSGTIISFLPGEIRKVSIGES